MKSAEAPNSASDWKLPALTPGGNIALDPLTTKLEAGVLIEVQGMNSQPQFNGALGEVKKWNRKNERWTVHLQPSSFGDFTDKLDMR